MLDFLLEVLGIAAQDPTILFLAILCAFAVGMLAGHCVRPAGNADARTRATPLHTNNSSLIDLQARRAMQGAGARPRARAGKSPLIPSYDGRNHAAAANQTPDSPRA